MDFLFLIAKANNQIKVIHRNFYPHTMEIIIHYLEGYLVYDAK